MKTIAIILSFLICINVYPQKKKEFVSVWNDHGNADQEIPVDSYIFFKKGRLYYFISNDDENIYLNLRVEDSEIQTKILKQGMTVWINTDGKQLKKTGIRFPTGSQTRGKPDIRNIPEPSQNIEGNPNSPINQANTIELIGIGTDRMNRIPAHNTDNFRGSVRYNNEGTLLYRLVLPVAKLGTAGDAEANKPMLLTFGIEAGPLMQAMRPGSLPGGMPPGGTGAPGGGGGGRPSGGGGGRPGGGRPGGGVPGGAGPSAQPASPVILWIKNIKLATEK